MTGTTWTLLSSVALASEHVFGNGYNLSITDGTGMTGATYVTNSGIAPASNAYGSLTPNRDGSGSALTNGNGIGIPTKAQTGAHPEYSGLVVDTITIYTWERTA